MTGANLPQSIALISALSFATLGAGLAVQVVLAARLGTSQEMDAYLVAITLPTLIAAVALIAFPSVLVPILKERLALGKRREAWDAFIHTFTLAGLISLGMAFLMFLGAPSIIRMAAPGFDADATRLTAMLLRFMIIGAVFDVLRGMLSAHFYAQERFFLPQFVPIVNHLIMLFAAVYLLTFMGLQGLAIAWAAGSAAMFIVLFLVAAKENEFRIDLGLQDPAVRKVASLFLPAIIVAALNQATPLVDRVVASTLPVGSVSYLGYGSKILEIMMRTVPMGVALALFPVLSHRAAGQEWADLAETILSGMRWMILGTVPLAIVVASLRVPLVTLFFERGVFDKIATEGVSEALGWYAWALIPGSLTFLLTFAFFSLQELWLLARIGLMNLVGTALLDYLLASLLGFSGIPVAALGLSVLWALTMVTILARRFLVIRREAILVFGLQVIAAGAAMGLVTSLLWSFAGSRGDHGVLLAAEILGVSFVAMVLYLLVLHLFGNADVQNLRNLIAGRAPSVSRE